MNDYKEKINALIPIAEREANLKLEGVPKKSEYRVGICGSKYQHCLWTEFFHKAMNRLAKEAGYRS